MNLLERYVGIDKRNELRTLTEGQGALGGHLRDTVTTKTHG